MKRLLLLGLLAVVVSSIFAVRFQDEAIAAHVSERLWVIKQTSTALTQYALLPYRAAGYLIRSIIISTAGAMEFYLDQDGTGVTPLTPDWEFPAGFFSMTGLEKRVTALYANSDYSGDHSAMVEIEQP